MHLDLIDIQMLSKQIVNSTIFVLFSYYHPNVLYHNLCCHVAVYCSCPEYDQCMDEMLSHINTIPTLKEVWLALRFLTVQGASSILHLIQTSSSLRKIE